MTGVFKMRSVKNGSVESLWQAVTAKSHSSFKSWSNRLLALVSCKS